MLALTDEIDRRRRTSGQSYALTALPLKKCARRYALANITIGDDQGVVVSQVGDKNVSGALSAFAPIWNEFVGSLDREQILQRVENTVPGARNDRLSIRSVELGSGIYHLAVLGERRKTRKIALFELISKLREADPSEVTLAS